MFLIRILSLVQLIVRDHRLRQADGHVDPAVDRARGAARDLETHAATSDTLAALTMPRALRMAAANESALDSMLSCTMKLENIAPITELKRDAASLIERAYEQRSPIVITQNGRATAVLQDVASYEQDRHAFVLLRLALQGEADIAAGRTVSRAEHKKRLAARSKAPESK
jgi:prevent-host-death family protein